MPLQPGTPDWFNQAIDCAHGSGEVEVDGTGIETIVWGERGHPGLLFVHGMMAHARWWDFIAPFFADRFRCASLSFSGMGRSGWRERYSVATYVEELAAVMEVAGLYEGGVPPIIVAHSFGTFPARRFAESRGRELGGVVLVDGPLRETTRYAPSPPRLYSLKPYPTIEQAVVAFRLMPEQPCANPWLVAHVAAEGLRKEGEHWFRSFDPELRAKMAAHDYHAGLAATQCPMAFVWGERSRLNTAEAQRAIDATFPDAPRIEIPDAAHHVMLDQPLALVAALRGLLTGWPRVSPTLEEQIR
ncbi:MAG TPA: alpha/beta hydrolase [Luteimonas sp.]|nr:alpha/beta hydrolase [Luteimonas sp.]HRP71748.1 alpha/beta hydrolase [Luteimonas sp.]